MQVLLAVMKRDPEIRAPELADLAQPCEAEVDQRRRIASLVLASAPIAFALGGVALLLVGLGMDGWNPGPGSPIAARVCEVAFIFGPLALLQGAVVAVPCVGFLLRSKLQGHGGFGTGLGIGLGLCAALLGLPLWVFLLYAFGPYVPLAALDVIAQILLGER